VKNQLKTLNAQIKIVEGLEHARARLAATLSLDSNTLSKCDVFMRYVNSAPDSSFGLEVRKLNLDELVFCSISFEERRLKSAVHHFAASNIRAYMTKSRVSCLGRPEILTRLRRLSAESEGKLFHKVYTALQAAHHSSLNSASVESDGHLSDGMCYTSHNGKRY
jgi:hypothetical protein